MTNEKMTIHQALCELKILDKRIPTLIKDARFVVENKHSNTKINGVSIEEAKNDFKASYDKITDLIKRRKAIKRAVTLFKCRDRSYNTGHEADYCRGY